MPEVFGWDIGGVNTKLARVAAGTILHVSSRPYEVQRAPHALVTLLREMAAEARSGSAGQPATHVVTMTAELSQLFRTKREGVSFVLDAVEEAFPSAVLRVWTVDGRFVEIDRARLAPLDVAACELVRDRSPHRQTSSRCTASRRRDDHDRHHSRRWRGRRAKVARIPNGWHPASSVHRCALLRPKPL